MSNLNISWTTPWKVCRQLWPQKKNISKNFTTFVYVLSITRQAIFPLETSLVERDIKYKSDRYVASCLKPINWQMSSVRAAVLEVVEDPLRLVGVVAFSHSHFSSLRQKLFALRTETKQPSLCECRVRHNFPKHIILPSPCFCPPWRHRCARPPRNTAAVVVTLHSQKPATLLLVFPCKKFHKKSSACNWCDLNPTSVKVLQMGCDLKALFRYQRIKISCSHAYGLELR